eukprot:605489-Rhodomonas_salina.3
MLQYTGTTTWLSLNTAAMQSTASARNVAISTVNGPAAAINGTICTLSSCNLSILRGGPITVCPGLLLASPLLLHLSSQHPSSPSFAQHCCDNCTTVRVQLSQHLTQGVLVPR